MTDAGKVRLLNHEGEVLHAYTDTLGFLTIGVGHLIDNRRGGGISQRISRLMFDEDIDSKTLDCKQAFPWFNDLDPVRQDALINLCFNLGVDGLKQFKRMLAAVERQDWHAVAFELFNSQWARQVSKDRRQDLTNALEKGRWE